MYFLGQPLQSMVRVDANSIPELYFEAGIAAPGLVTIPVCDFLRLC